MVIGGLLLSLAPSCFPFSSLGNPAFAKRGGVKNSKGVGREPVGGVEEEQTLVNNVHHPDTMDLGCDQCVCTLPMCTSMALSVCV